MEGYTRIRSKFVNVWYRLLLSEVVFENISSLVMIANIFLL